MKKYISLLLLCLLLCGCLFGCTKPDKDSEESKISSEDVSGIVMDSEIVTDESGIQEFVDDENGTADENNALPSGGENTDTVSENSSNEKSKTSPVNGTTDAGSSGTNNSGTNSNDTADNSTETESTAIKEGPGGIELPYDYFD